MRNFSQKFPAKFNLCLFISFLFFSFTGLAFAGTASYEKGVMGPQGGPVKNIPEKKKGTVLIQRGEIAKALLEGGAEDLSTLEQMAREYRVKGREFQAAGDLEEAMKLYQKAIELDPSYAVVYNDLGLIYEAKGFIDRAEESYLKALKIEKYFLSPYTNLAILYENKRSLDRALYYWNKRAQLGDPADPWTQKALQRQSDIRLVLAKDPSGDAREQETISLHKDVRVKQADLLVNDQAMAQEHFRKAKIYYKRGDDLSALKSAVNAIQLDSSNSEIEDFIFRVQKRILSQ